MTKLKMLHCYNIADVPDHIVEELKDHIRKLLKAIEPILMNSDANLTLSAMNHIMAIMIKCYISEEPAEIKKAARVCAKNLCQNVKFYTDVDPLDMED